MSAVDQMQTLMLGVLLISLGIWKMELAWANRSPRLERFSGVVHILAGLALVVRGAWGGLF